MNGGELLITWILHKVAFNKLKDELKRDYGVDISIEDEKYGRVYYSISEERYQKDIFDLVKADDHPEL